MYSLRVWTNPRNPADIRVYIGGTTRQSVYFKREPDGRVVWSSKTHDTDPKYRTGDHYGKVRKDGAAAREVADAFSINLGDATTGEAEWSRILQIAADGIQVPRCSDIEED